MNDPKPPFDTPRQPMPGRTDEMTPRPDHGETSYRGSGKLAGKRAVITGADSGIGRAVAIAFAREGADVLVAYLNEHDDAAETKKWIEQAGRKAVLVAGDVSSAEHCRHIVERAVAELGGLDILVNNAAHQASFESIDDIDDDEWEHTFAVNVHAMFYLVKAAVPHLKNGGVDHQHGVGQRGHAEPEPARLRDDEGRDPEPQRRPRAAAGRGRHPRQRGRAGSGLDAADPVDDARREGPRVRQAGPDEASGPAGRARDGLRHARRPAVELHLRRDDRGDRRQAVPLTSAMAGDRVATTKVDDPSSTIGR